MDMIKSYGNPKYGCEGNEPVTYDFYNRRDRFYGFNSFQMCVPAMENHKLRLDITFSGCSFLSEDHLDLDAAIYNVINIRMTNPTPGNRFRVCWTLENDPQCPEEQYADIALIPQDTDFRTYRLELGGHPRWSGKIRQLKFMPALGYRDAVIEIDFIQFAGSFSPRIDKTFLSLCL